MVDAEAVTVRVEGYMQIKKRGNPAWVKGKSANPYGRPIGQTSFVAFCENPGWFLIHHIRWERFCFELMEPLYTGAAAARRAGFSPKSARFIASRLRRKPIIQAIRRRLNEVTSLDRTTLTSLLKRGDLWKWDPTTGRHRD